MTKARSRSPIGARESAWVGVTRTDGTAGPVTADIDLTPQPNLPGTHRGYAFVKSASDLPLWVLQGGPGAPAAPSVSAASSSSLTVMWTAPDDGGSAITGYDVQYRADGSGDWTDGSHDGTATTATLTGLGSGTTYEVQVRAANEAGAGPWSDPGSGATEGQAVPAPQDFAASNGNEQVTLTWYAPAEDADIARHEYRFKTTGDYPAAWTAIDDSAAGRAPRGLGRGDGSDQRRGLHVPVAGGERRRRRQRRGTGGSRRRRRPASAAAPSRCATRS